MSSDRRDRIAPLQNSHHREGQGEGEGQSGDGGGLTQYSNEWVGIRWSL